MFREIQIVKTNERQNSHLDSQRNKFKITSNTILSGDSYFANEKIKRNTQETERTEHQVFLQKMGYSISEDLNYQEFQKNNRASSISTDPQSEFRIPSGRSQANSTRGQSIEICHNYEQLNNQNEHRYNAKLIRRTFNYEDSDGGFEYLSDQSQHLDKNTSPKNITFVSNSKQTISTNRPSSQMKSKFKRIRMCFQIIKALFRMKSLCRQKQASWQNQVEVLKRNQKVLKFNESLTIIKTKQWTQMVLAKMISIIQQKGLDKQKLNFIDTSEGMTQLQKDQALSVVSNIFLFAMSNLVIMTSKCNFLNELSLLMYQDQYFDQRKQFSKFVSERANYITQDYPKLTDEEKQIILSECIIINHLIPSLVRLTQSLEPLKCNKPSIEFLVRCLISLFEVFFVNHFSSFPQMKMINKKIKYSQHQLGKNSDSMILILNTQVKSNNLIEGTYTQQQLQPFFEKENWVEQNQKKMKQVVFNLVDNCS